MKASLAGRANGDVGQRRIAQAAACE